MDNLYMITNLIKLTLMRNHPKTFSFLLLLLLGFIWGTGYSIARFAMTHGVPPLGYGFWQSLGPAILLSLMVLRTPTRAALAINISASRYYFFCALTGIVIPNTTMYFAAPHLPAGLLAVIVNTVPIMAYPIALMARVESFHWLRLMGVCCAVAGLMCLVLPNTSLPSPHMIPWVLTVLLTPLSFACCAIYISRHQPQQSNPITLSTGTLLFSSILLLPIVLYSKSFYSLHLPLTLPDSVILLEIVLSSLGYILFFQLIKVAGPVYYSLVDTIVSLTGLLWGYFLFHERLNQWTGTAVLLILFSLVLITKYQSMASHKLEAANV